MYTKCHKITTFTTRLYRLHIVKNTDFKIVFKKNQGFWSKNLLRKPSGRG